MDDLTKEEEKMLEEGIIYSKKKTLLEDLKNLEDSLPEVEIVKQKPKISMAEKWIIFLFALLVIFAIFGYWLRKPAEQAVEPTPPHLVAFNQYFQAYPTLGLVRNSEGSTLRTEALEAYSQQDFAKAIEKFEALTKENANPQTQDELLNLFFLGIAYVGNGEADKGIEQLKRFQELATVLDGQADWYLAMAYLWKGDLERLEQMKNSISKVKDRERLEGILEALGK